MLVALLLSACTDASDSGSKDTSTDTNTDSDSGITHIGDADTDVDGDTDADSDTDTDTDPEAEAAYQALYDASVLQDINLTLSKSAMEELAADPDTYVSGGFQHGDVTLDGVGIRLRGGETFDTKPSFRVKFNEFDGERYATLERMVLDAMIEDPTQLHAVLAYNLWQQSGLVGPRASYARVYLNGAYMGLYANLEVLDDRFADRYYAADEGGDFWEAQDSADITENGIHRFELVSGDGDTQALANADAVLNAADADFYAVVGTVIDYPQYLDFWAWSLVLGCQDGYPYETDEFNLYRLPSSGLYTWTNQALDNSFDTAIDWDALRGNVGVKCMYSVDCRRDLWDAVSSSVAVFESLDAGTMADDLMVLTDQAVTDDPNKPFTTNEVDQARSRFSTNLTGLPGRVRGWIGERPAGGDTGDSGP